MLRPGGARIRHSINIDRRSARLTQEMQAETKKRLSNQTKKLEHARLAPMPPKCLDTKSPIQVQAEPCVISAVNAHETASVLRARHGPMAAARIVNRRCGSLYQAARTADRGSGGQGGCVQINIARLRDDARARDAFPGHLARKRYHETRRLAARC
jgi:hypothetical protein